MIAARWYQKLFKAASFFVIFALALYIIPKYYLVNAQGIKSQNWMCLDIAEVNGHTATLKTKPQSLFLPPGIEVYTVECLGTDQGEICTTADVAADDIVFGDTNTNLRRLETNFGYKRNSFTGRQPLTSDSEGKIGPFDWTSEVYPSVDHKFFGVTFMEPLSMDIEALALKLGTFYFQNANGKCSSQRWDPYGRIFDTKSLEPIRGVAVKLLVKKGILFQQIALPGITNPQNTLSDGSFSFIVPDGIYKLEPGISSHLFPVTMNAPHPNYIKAYFDLYSGEPIVQTGVMQHRDIPMESMGTPFTAPVKIMGYTISLDKLNKVYNITGVLSHPLSIAELYLGSQKLSSVTSDKLGSFAINISSESINPSQNLTLKAVKVDLTKLRANLLQKLMAVQAQNSQNSVTLPTIPNYLEGYAYDSNGQVIPNAQVNIFLDNSQRTFHSVFTDKTGYFKISSQFLPSLPYSIQFVWEDRKNTTQTSADGFILSNRITAQNKNVDYNAFLPDQPFNISPDQSYITPPADQLTEEDTINGTAKNIELLALLITIAIISVLGIMYHLKKKKI